MAKGRLNMIFGDEKGNTDQSTKFDNIGLFSGSHSIIHNGIVIYEGEDTV